MINDDSILKQARELCALITTAEGLWSFADGFCGFYKLDKLMELKVLSIIGLPMDAAYIEAELKYLSEIELEDLRAFQEADMVRRICT